ncbi:MAG: S8 family serine peptidase, partial [Gemmatimonadales bacterium]
SNSTGATLLGGRVVDAVGGIAHFPDLSIDRAGTGYTLIASASSLTGATSVPFDVTAPPPPAATHLVFAVQPQNVEAGSAVAVQVVVLDDSGHTVTTFNGTVGVALGGNPGNATLHGTSTASVVSGVATFPDLSLTRAGAGYTLTASSAGLAGATSNAFSILPGPAAALAFVTPPSNTSVLSTIQPAVQVVASDQWGNVVTGFSGQVQVAIGHDASLLGNANLSGTTTASAVNGVATFPGLHIDEAGAGYTLTANFAGGPPLVTSTSFDITVL